jgi:hypothetical protein
MLKGKSRPGLLLRHLWLRIFQLDSPHWIVHLGRVQPVPGLFMRAAVLVVGYRTGYGFMVYIQVIEKRAKRSH